MPYKPPKLTILAGLLLTAGLHAAEPPAAVASARVRHLLSQMSRADKMEIENDVKPEAPNMRTAGIYGYLAPTVAAPRTPGVWQSYDVTLVGRTITVALNGKVVIDRKEIPGITGGALDSREGADGPLVLQGAEDGQVTFRNIVITPGSRKP